MNLHVMSIYAYTFAILCINCPFLYDYCSNYWSFVEKTSVKEE